METAVLYCSQIRKEDLVMKHVKSLNTKIRQVRIHFYSDFSGVCEKQTPLACQK